MGFKLRTLIVYSKNKNFIQMYVKEKIGVFYAW